MRRSVWPAQIHERQRHRAPRNYRKNNELLSRHTNDNSDKASKPHSGLTYQYFRMTIDEAGRSQRRQAAGLAAEVIGFLKAYKKSVVWAYSSPLALDAYAKLSGQSSDAAKYIFQEFTSKEGAQIDQIKDEDRGLAKALAAKRLPRALTHKDIEGVYDLVLK